MRTISQYELNRITSTTSESFQDSCTIDILSITRNSLGEEVPLYTSGSEIDCGFELIGGSEAHKEGLVLTPTRAIVKVAKNTTVSIKDKVTITKIFGVEITPIQFEVVNEPIVGLDCLVLECVSKGV